ncbi:twin-arginine translocation signal domain-containing protein [Streptomyces massasporeus]|uniref:twin-arginine translocation signal domain-containing protein n=1 Tax=Streptomyces massasporeus TaxID=67324 RepID=UPI00381E7D5E
MTDPTRRSVLRGAAAVTAAGALAGRRSRSGPGGAHRTAPLVSRRVIPVPVIAGALPDARVPCL